MGGWWGQPDIPPSFPGQDLENRPIKGNDNSSEGSPSKTSKAQEPEISIRLITHSEGPDTMPSQSTTVFRAVVPQQRQFRPPPPGASGHIQRHCLVVTTGGGGAPGSGGWRPGMPVIIGSAVRNVLSQGSVGMA